jgi:glutamine amidotransferase
VFKSVEPAWSDRNLHELAGHVRSGLVFAHIRASTGTPIQQTNCHPFRHGRWLWMHNGSIAQFREVKRELMLAVDPSLYLDVEGSTDSEAFFFLALTWDWRTTRRRPWKGPSGSSSRWDAVTGSSIRSR